MVSVTDLHQRFCDVSYVCLCFCLKDGAYLVRDSTRQQANQPFTLMVFYQDKVYNIQIKQQNQHFLLGTGLKVQEVNMTLLSRGI